ncbi:hypothetical protein EE612_005079 [Oryza sativa]|nr:hypothetical protein EE612_005079 [Oryza sativa]
MMAETGDQHGPVIGIDLGTACSCVAVWQNGRAEIVTNEHGGRATPSYAAFTDTERLVGDAAKSQASRNPTNTVFATKRLMGRRFSDASVQDGLKLWPFKVVPGRGAGPWRQADGCRELQGQAEAARRGGGRVHAALKDEGRGRGLHRGASQERRGHGARVVRRPPAPGHQARMRRRGARRPRRHPRARGRRRRLWHPRNRGRQECARL